MINILYLHIPTLDPGKHQAVMTMVSMFCCDKKSDSDKQQFAVERINDMHLSFDTQTSCIFGRLFSYVPPRVISLFIM